MKQPFYIYGAGIVAASVYTAIKELYRQVPAAFLVSDLGGNPSEIDGICVMQMSKKGTLDNNNHKSKILIAAPIVHLSSIVERLYSMGVSKEQIIIVDNMMENELMERYYNKISEITIDSLLNVEDKSVINFFKVNKNDKRDSVFVGQAKCHADKPLNKAAELPAYVTPIQVGAALTSQVIAGLQDNQGDNISIKNSIYCELTAGYYIWKNSCAEYKGLCHYRRIFDIDDVKMKQLLEIREAWDVILPYPSVHYPDISKQHSRYIDETDWDALQQALKETASEYYGKFDHIFQKQFFYNYNMLIARREVFDDYCSFLFSVLGRTEELTNPKGWERSDRFAGYLGENLTTLYFMANRDKLKIIHTGKILLV